MQIKRKKEKEQPHSLIQRSFKYFRQVSYLKKFTILILSSGEQIFQKKVENRCVICPPDLLSTHLLPQETVQHKLLHQEAPVYSSSHWVLPTENSGRQWVQVGRLPPCQDHLRPKNNNNSDFTSPGFALCKPYTFANSTHAISCPLLLSVSSIVYYHPN